MYRCFTSKLQSVVTLLSYSWKLFLSGQAGWLNAQYVKNNTGIYTYQRIFTALTGQSNIDPANIKSKIGTLSQEIDTIEKSINKKLDAMQLSSRSSELSILRSRRNELWTSISVIDDIHSKLLTHTSTDPDSDLFWTDFLQYVDMNVLIKIGVDIELSLDNVVKSIIKQRVSMLFDYEINFIRKLYSIQWNLWLYFIFIQIYILKQM